MEALQKYDANAESAAVERVPELPIALPPLDAIQARIDHVSALLSAAYQKASTLELSDEERSRLTAMLPDGDVCTGAGGDANLLYIQHGSIRKILFEVFGPGKWSLINRRTFMQDGYVFADCVLVIRGCYVGEAIGAHRWTPANARMNYSDAIESAQSEALRRIAGKYLGVGIQVWDKHYCEEWKRRQSNPQAPKAVAAPAQQKPATPKTATPETLKWFVEQASLHRQEFEAWMKEQAILLPTETLEDTPLPKVPTSKSAFLEMLGKVEAFTRGAVEPEPEQSQAQDLDEKYPDSRPNVTGTLKQVTEKTGKKKDGSSWTLYGINVDQVWANSFSNTDGEKAKTLKGKEVTMFYEEGEKGNTLLELKEVF